MVLWALMAWVDVDGVAVDGQVRVHADRAAALLGDLPEQAGRPGQQGEAAQQLHGQAEVGQRGAADAGAVEREPAAEHLLVHPADGLEQPQVRPVQPLLLGDLDQHRRPGITYLVHRVPEPGNEAPGRLGLPYRLQRQHVPAGLVRGQPGAGGRVPLQHVMQVAPAVLGDPQEPGSAAEQPGGQRSLQRVGGGQVGQPRGDRGRGEPVVG
jgi:hypothetical protein